MPFKKDDSGKLIINEQGLLTHVDEHGAEKPYDVDAEIKQKAEYAKAATQRAQELEELRGRYKALDGVQDLAAFVAQAKKDAETVAAMADKDREAEATIQKRITEAIKGAVTPLEAERDGLKDQLAKIQGELNSAVISNAFAHSAFVNEKMKGPALAQEIFAKQFYVKDGKPVGRDAEGKDIYGMEGIASFDEALQKLVEKSPFKNDVLRQPPSGGDSRETYQQHNPGKMSAGQIGNLSQQAYIKARKEGRI